MFSAISSGWRHIKKMPRSLLLLPWKPSFIRIIIIIVYETEFLSIGDIDVALSILILVLNPNTIKCRPIACSPVSIICIETDNGFVVNSPIINIL